MTDHNGTHSYYPITENLHGAGQLVVSHGPAANVSESVQQLAQQIHDKIADELNYVGVLAIEFFQVGEQLVVNEIAPRVHNSGHWSQQGCITSQFENHIRAVAGLPLGSTNTTAYVTMINYVGEAKPSNEVITLDDVHLHWYDKEVRAKRKMGHINVVAHSRETLAAKVSDVAQHLPQSLKNNLI